MWVTAGGRQGASSHLGHPRCDCRGCGGLRLPRRAPELDAHHKLCDKKVDDQASAARKGTRDSKSRRVGRRRAAASEVPCAGRQRGAPTSRASEATRPHMHAPPCAQPRPMGPAPPVDNCGHERGRGDGGVVAQVGRQQGHHPAQHVGPAAHDLLVGWWGGVGWSWGGGVGPKEAPRCSCAMAWSRACLLPRAGGARRGSFHGMQEGKAATPGAAGGSGAAPASGRSAAAPSRRPWVDPEGRLTGSAMATVSPTSVEMPLQMWQKIKMRDPSPKPMAVPAAHSCRRVWWGCG